MMRQGVCILSGMDTCGGAQQLNMFVIPLQTQLQVLDGRVFPVFGGLQTVTWQMRLVGLKKMPEYEAWEKSFPELTLAIFLFPVRALNAQLLRVNSAASRDSIIFVFTQIPRSLREWRQNQFTEMKSQEK